MKRTLSVSTKACALCVHVKWVFNYFPPPLKIMLTHKNLLKTASMNKVLSANFEQLTVQSVETTKKDTRQ